MAREVARGTHEWERIKSKRFRNVNEAISIMKIKCVVSRVVKTKLNSMNDFLFVTAVDNINDGSASLSGLR